ncbi:HNH endonuclease [Neobacillus sp.]|uniref:HNH endonuclease n=1 Tax=Neobacillus sp. TaxID=2675273 RepID=UPI0028A0D89D|nr:HNH endonuclease [Neobacillus sp.]
MIGSSCRIYKTCKICGQTKWYKEFGSKGKRKRRTYCKQCKNRKDELKSSSPYFQYIFDPSLLKKSDIEVRIKLPSKKRIRYKVSYEQAVLLVNEGMAGIVHETLIHKFYDKQTFKQMILMRHNYTCWYCGKYGDTIDHVIPKVHGGISSPNNCVCACKRCNKNKDNLTLQEFLFYIEPLTTGENVQLLHLKQQLLYLIQTFKSLSSQLVNAGVIHGHEQLIQKIERVENILRKLKVEMIEKGKVNLHL